MIRKFSIFLVCTLLFLIIFKFQKRPSEEESSPLTKKKITIRKEKTFQKKENKKPKVSKIRKSLPVSVKKLKDKKTNTKLPNKRVIFESGKSITEEDMEKLDFINEENPDWKEELSRKLLDTLDKKPNLKVIKEKSLIKLIGKKARYLEQAIVIIEYENGNENSFRALIDSETGKIIRSWDRTIHENFGKRPEGLKPSGSL